MRPPPPAALRPSSPRSSALKHLSQQRLGRPDKSGLLCCYSSFFVAAGKWCVRRRGPHHTLSASLWVQVELGDLGWPGMPVRGANQKLPLIAPLRWLTFAFEWVACSDSVNGGKEEKNKVKEAVSGQGLRRGVSSPVQVSSVSSLWIFSMPVRVSANAVLGYSALVLLPSSHPQSLSYYSSTSSD